MLQKNICYTLQSADSARFMVSWLSNLVSSFSELIHKIKCKHGYNDKKYEMCKTKYKYYDYCFEYTNFKEDLMEFKCLFCNKNYQQKFNKKLKERFFNIYKFSNNDNNKFISLLGKFVYPMYIWMIWKNSMKLHYLKKIN